ncbi:hypothetical protein ACP70R_033139 [Stipagrostis hirtigluma subsp. patula]
MSFNRLSMSCTDTKDTISSCARSLIPETITAKSIGLAWSIVIASVEVCVTGHSSLPKSPKLQGRPRNQARSGRASRTLESSGLIPLLRFLYGKAQLTATVHISPLTPPNPTSSHHRSSGRSAATGRRLRRPSRLPAAGGLLTNLPQCHASSDHLSSTPASRRRFFSLTLPAFTNVAASPPVEGQESRSYSTMNMKHTCTHVDEEVRSVHLLKIDAFSVTKATINNNSDCIRSRCDVDGYDWEIRLYPSLGHHEDTFVVALKLVFLGEPRANTAVKANLNGRLVDSCGGLIEPLKEHTVSAVFQRPSDCSPPFYLGTGDITKGFPRPPTVTVECTITVHKDLKVLQLPSSNLHQHLGELLRSKAGADITFLVSGESFPAHKSILSARSPVFMAEFFGCMKERISGQVEIKNMEPAVFEAMLSFIYTDTVLNLDQKTELPTTMAQHLLVAADRYGLGRLKLICERMLALQMDVATVAATLTLAEQHGCSQLKANCVEFITDGSPEILEAILATEGYKHLEASSPSVVTELLKAAHCKKRSRSTDDK